jgi:hypothetical protein
VHDAQPTLPIGKQPPERVASKELIREEIAAGKEADKSELLRRMERGEHIVTTPDKTARNPNLKPWLYGYGVKFFDQGDGEAQIKISWHICPKDLSKALQGIRDQCLGSAEDRRLNPLFTADLK